MLTRTIAGLVFATLLTTGAASASSFVTPEPMTAKLSPSMILLGEPAAQRSIASDRTEPAGTPAKAVASAIDRTPLAYPFPGSEHREGTRAAGDADFVRISPSIIAMTAEPEPAVSFEQVAAVGKDAGEDEQRNAPGPEPTVIRGGVVDNGGTAEASVPAAHRQQQTVASRPAPAAGTRAAPEAAASSQSASSSPQQPREPDVPVPSPTPAPLPANIIPQTKIQ